MALVILVTVLLSLLYYAECVTHFCEHFSKLCNCGKVSYYGRDMYVTNCTNAGFTDANVLQNLPLETEVLIFVGNNISELPINIFGIENNYTKLKVIDMSNNNIREIKGKTFHRVPYVERLILNHNNIHLSSQHPRIFSNFEKLTELHLTNAFMDNSSEDLASKLHNVFINSNLTHLLKLHLEQNEISGFQDRRVFCDLPKLMDLHLGNNLLTKIDFQLDCLHHLRFLDLENNIIDHFTNDELYMLSSIAQRQFFSIDIRNNRFSCSCANLNLHNWLYGSNSNITVRDKKRLQCYHYSVESNSTESFVNFNGSHCNVKVMKMRAQPYHSVGNYTVALLILILIGCLLFVILKQTSERCRRTSILASKVHYTVIGKADDQETHV